MKEMKIELREDIAIINIVYYDILKKEENSYLKLKENVKKAIEYIEKNCYDEKQLCNGLWEEIPELLNILKGVDNND